MNSTDLLVELSARCRCEVSVTVNQHRCNYESITSWLERMESSGALEVAPDVRVEMIARDTAVWVQVYPQTPVGFYAVFHWDVREALRLALDAVTSEAPR